MARPHPALIELAAGRPLPVVEDPDRLLDSAVEHRTTGLLWTRVEAGELKGSEQWERTLAMLSLRDEARHRRLWESLENVADKLAGAGIQIAAFKGVTAEARWYGRIGERPCYDVDILVDPAAADRADDVVACLDPDHSLVGHLQELFHRGLVQAVELEVDNVNIDLHFDLFKLGIPSRANRLVWERTQQLVTPSGGSIRVLDAETALVHRLISINKDRFRYLLAYAEIARILSSAPDLRVVQDLARVEGHEVIVNKSLTAVLSTLRLPTEDIPQPQGWRSRAWDYLWRSKTRLLGETSTVKYARRGYLLMPALARNRTGDTLRWMTARMFPPRAYLDYHHPDARGPYAVRIVTSRVHQLVRNRQARSEIMHRKPPATTIPSDVETRPRRHRHT
ncbi:MAG: hypothetical protein GWP04_07555 [Gammaproteobacteria bacterium]|nr:hypothetical protein [Gammaproteobacteria bacterium]